MRTPPGIAKFDSSTAMLLSLARFLDGRDFAGLAQPALLQVLARQADHIPRGLRERIFALLGATEGVQPERIDKVSTTDVAKWLTSRYPQRRYPAVMIGSSNGALVHIAAALGIPWLPQTFLTLVRQAHVHTDDPVHAMESEIEPARRFLELNPDSQLHHLHDPGQDRLMLELITYFRSKFLRLPEAYRGFLESSLAPGGTLVIVECERRWPATQLDDRYYFQFGAIGGPTTEEYFQGSERVEDYLRRHGSTVRRWHPPRPNTEAPEAEWGFEPALRADIADFARQHGYRVLRLVFDDPEHPSPLVADFHRRWYRERELADNRLTVESFVMLEPLWVLRTGSVPYWMTFNMQPSLDMVNRYLDGTDPYDEIYLMLFAHGVNSVGLPPIDEWRKLLARARHEGRFLGVDPETYPAHFAAFGRYSQEMRGIETRHPLPNPLPLEKFEQFVAEHGKRCGVRFLPA